MSAEREPVAREDPDREDSLRDVSSPRPRAGSRRFGRYLLRHELAKGGMATVYLAQIDATEGFRKWLALKLIHAQYADDPKFVRMFANEARLAARLDHTNVCNVFDFGESDGTYYLAMEYLHGVSLDGVMRRTARGTPLAHGIAARIVADAARGLHAAHELCDENGVNAEVVHRDVSPQNIFVLYDGVAKIVDFGVARSRDQLGEATAAGEIKGKVAYMAPEQVTLGQIDRRIDIFALGAVLWEITLRQRLFRRDNDIATMKAVLDAVVPVPTSIDPTYPKALEAIVLRALARSPDDRFQTAEAFSRALDEYIASSGARAGTADVGDMMRATFADAIAARTALLRGLKDETVDTAMAEPTRAEKFRARSDTGTGDELAPTLATRADLTLSTAAGIAGDTSSVRAVNGAAIPEAPRSRASRISRRIAVVVAITVAAAAGSAAVAWRNRWQSPARVGPPVEPVAVARPRAEPIAPVPVQSARPPVATPAPAVAALAPGATVALDAAAPTHTSHRRPRTNDTRHAATPPPATQPATTEPSHRVDPMIRGYE